MFFGKGEQAPASAPAPMQMASAASSEIAPPIPAMRPAALGAVAQMAAVDQPPLPFSTTGSAPLDDAELLTANAAPIPATKSQALLMATSAALPASNGETAVTAIAALTAPIPQPRLQMSSPADDMLTAYAPILTQDPEAQRALQMIIERSTTASTRPRAPIAVLPLPGTANGLHTASLGGQPAVNALMSLFGNPQDTTKQWVAPIGAASAGNLRPDVNAMRNVELIAPDLEHVAEVFLTPVVMTSDHFAVIFDHDEADFDPTTEMGRYVTVMGAAAVPAELSATRFQTN
jgi:hypothetical protein